jgi:hypothetical protein
MSPRDDVSSSGRMGRRDRGGDDLGAPWGELNVGPRQVFEHAGFVQVSRPTVRRVVMRIDVGR